MRPFTIAVAAPVRLGGLAHWNDHIGDRRRGPHRRIGGEFAQRGNEAGGGGIAPGRDQRQHQVRHHQQMSGLADAGTNDMIFIGLNLLGGRQEHLRYGYIWASVYRSFSRGRVTINSADPDVNPEIRFQMLSDPRDLIRMRDAMRRLLELSLHPAIRAIAKFER